MKIYNALTLFQFVVIVTMNVYGVFSDGEFHATKNGGYCCSSDNVKHDACIVSTWGTGFEAGFEISECKTRCSNDSDCKGYSIETVNTETETATTSYDICYLYTTSNATEFCTFNYLNHPNMPQTSSEQIDENAKCKETSAVSPRIEYHEGCHIKIKVKTDNVTRGCQCNDKCSKSSGFFNEKPYCHVSSDSSCPDLAHYTWDVVHSVSAEACKKFPNDYGFIRFEEEICVHEADDELKSFMDSNDSSISYHNARDECEQYCLDEDDCWGCTFHCGNDCKWIAITECKEFRTDRFQKGGATQKPVCFDIRTVNGESLRYEHESWNIATCSKTVFVQNRPYDMTIQRCCLAPKTYDLTCSDTYQDGMDGWNGGLIEIQGHKYCDDFVDQSVKRRIKILKSNLTENKGNEDISETRYIEINGQICTRTEGSHFSTKDKAKDACSSNEYCIGFMQKKFNILLCPMGNCGNDDVFQLCFNNGNRPFSDEDSRGNSIGQEYISYKKKESDNAPQMHLIPEAKAFSDRNFGTVIASDHFCPNGGKPFALNMIEWPRFVTCHCEDHCNWYKCRLEKPPSECLNGVNASWKWDKKGNYWVAQMNSANQTENSSTLSEHTNDGQEENINLVSMNVEHNGADLKHSKPKPSKVERYKKAAILALSLVFLLFVFAYFVRTPKKVFANKEVLTNNIKKVFTVFCALMAIYMIMTQVVKYFENNDASSIHFKEFNIDEDNKYPTFSICFEGDHFYYKNFENPLYETLGMNSVQYSNLLKGRASHVSEYNPSKKLYEKIPRNVKDVANINFNQLMFNLSDVVSRLELVAHNANHTRYYPEALTKPGLEKYAFELTYQTWNERCFTRISDDEDGARRKYDFLSLRYSILKDKWFENTEFKLIVHYPGQMIRSMHKPALTASFTELSSQIGQTVKIKLRELIIQQVTVLKMRKNSNQPCNDKIFDDDTKFIDEVVKKAGCIPVYLKSLSSQNLNYAECQTQEQISNVYQILNDYKDTLFSYNPPCIDMSVLIRDQHNKPLKNQHQEIDIKLLYNEGTYQEIVNTRDFGMDTFWISVGGFVGLFLGYSISQIPELLASIPDLFRKRKEG